MDTYVNIVRVFKDIDKSNYIRMLAYLQHLYLSLLKLKLFDAHVLLFDYFDSYLVLGFDMSGKLNLTKLSLTQIGLYITKRVNKS